MVFNSMQTLVHMDYYENRPLGVTEFITEVAEYLSDEEHQASVSINDVHIYIYHCSSSLIYSMLECK